MTAPTGLGLTVIAAVPLFPSLDAEIVAAPGEIAVTRPADVTVATCALLVDQATACPPNGAPDASRTCAVNCVLCPTTRAPLSGARAMLATGTCETVIEATPVCPSQLALMIAPPAATAVTSPPAVTVATVVLLDDHVTGRPDSTCPSASSASAPSCSVSPTSIEWFVDERRTAATGAGSTVTVESASLPSALAAIRTVPTLRPVTTPPSDTAAIDASSLAQWTCPPVIAFPCASRTSASSGRLAPTATLAPGGTTAIDSTDVCPGADTSIEQAASNTAASVAAELIFRDMQDIRVSPTYGTGDSDTETPPLRVSLAAATEAVRAAGAEKSGTPGYPSSSVGAGLRGTWRSGPRSP